MGLLRTSDLDLKGLRLMVHRLKGSHSGEHPLQPDEVRVLKAYLRARASKSPILFPSRRHTPSRGAPSTGVFLDPGFTDLARMREAAFERVPRVEVEEAMTAIGNLARPPDDRHYERVLKGFGSTRTGYTPNGSAPDS
jgi:integrase